MSRRKRRAARRRHWERCRATPECNLVWATSLPPPEPDSGSVAADGTILALRVRDRSATVCRSVQIVPTPLDPNVPHRISCRGRKNGPLGLAGGGQPSANGGSRVTLVAPRPLCSSLAGADFGGPGNLSRLQFVGYPHQRRQHRQRDRLVYDDRVWSHWLGHRHWLCSGPACVIRCPRRCRLRLHLCWIVLRISAALQCRRCRHARIRSPGAIARRLWSVLVVSSRARRTRTAHDPAPALGSIVGYRCWVGDTWLTGLWVRPSRRRTPRCIWSVVQ